MVGSIARFLTEVVSDLHEYEFWRHAVIGGIAISIVCSMLSVYVVLKRMSFIGQGISHSAFGGIALGVFLFAGSVQAEAKIYATALVFCLAVAFLIALATRHSKISEDSAIGIFFVVSMALGVIFFKEAKGYNRDIFSFLFGSILALTRAELVIILSLSVVVCLTLILLQKELLYYTFDENMAAVSGVRVNALHMLLLAILALTIVISVRIVGIILISAFLIMPGATAQLVCSRFPAMMVCSVVVGVLTTLGGLLLSYGLDWPTGAAIVLVQFAVFLVVFGLRKMQGNLSV